MSDVAIRVEGLGKKYRLGAERQSYYSLRDSIAGAARKPLGLARRLAGKASDPTQARPEFWALKDVNFEVKHGEVLGIIGRNGAGKSTLLKLLSEITEPTTGRISINGRVASLLEVGTGFHPELTGRENIYLNGAILGMTKAEIAGKFDEIVAFAEVEKFIDTQVKHYSSGMYLRLAFAVAAHLEPEILVVDEVLAVGDAQFQTKCLGKMNEVSRKGRTVLFVSHSMGSVLQLCSRCLLLHRGRLEEDGGTERTIGSYLSLGSAGTFREQLAASSRQGKGDVRIRDFAVRDEQGQEAHELISGRSYSLDLAYRSSRGEPLRNCRIGFTFCDRIGQYLFTCSTEQFLSGELVMKSEGSVLVNIPKFPLSQGAYNVMLFFEVNMEVQDWYSPGIEINVVDGNFHNGLRQYPLGAAGRGVLVDHLWKLDTVDII